MAFTFCTATQLLDRVSGTELRRGLDFNVDGVTDTSPELQLRQDASSFIAGYLGAYSLDDVAAKAGNANVVHEVVRVTLDACEWMLVKWREAVFPDRDWEKMRKANVSDLEQLRDRLRELDGDVVADVTYQSPYSTSDSLRGW